MVTQTEVAGNVFDLAYESFRETAETTLKTQHELFRHLTSQWPSMALPPLARPEQLQQLQKNWTKTVTDQTKRYQKALDTHYQAGIAALDEAFRVAQAKDPEEYRAKIEQLCRKSLDCLKEMGETQMHEFQTAVEQWMDLAKKMDLPKKEDLAKKKVGS